MVSRRVLAAVALLGAGGMRPAAGQIPPRRPLMARAAPTPDPDLADGTALPEGVRSLRVERDGEVLRTRPELRAPRRGTAGRGARLPALEATQGEGCRGVWVRVAAEAWICSDGGALTGDAPAGSALPLVPPGQVVPYQYAFATHAGVRTYRRLDDVPDENWAEEMERGMSVAVTGTARIDQGTFARTAGGRWVALRDLAWAHPSERAGIFFDPQESAGDVAMLRVNARAWPTPEGAVFSRGSSRDTNPLSRRDFVHVRERVTLRGREVARTDAGWLVATLLTPLEAPEAPADLAPRERWVDVDRRRQLLFAFEGRRPVFATLVSTGRSGNETAAGEHRVWSKLATTDMSNADDVELSSATALYTVARVPWVMFFHGDQALHGVFWHDQFGRARSHGCVNLAPRDAAWLFEWAPPQMPPGWTAVIPTPREPGLRVRVR
jgi:L,D-transpeptidase catalytic domain